MSNRWAKVPEWILPALLETPREKRTDASPHVALSCYVAIAGGHVDFRTGIVEKVTNAELAGAVGLNRRTVRRALALLERVGAVLIEDVTTRGGQAANRITLNVDAPRDVGRVRPPWARASNPPDACVIPLHRETAGQGVEGRTHAPPLYPESTSSPEEHNASQEEMGEWDATLPLPEWMQSRDRFGALRALRAASPPPEPGTRLQDACGTSGSDESESAGDATTATGEGRGGG